MINRIIDILNKTVGITDWRINEVRTESNELFFVHKSLETVRATDTVRTDVTVYCEHDGALGSASFSVYASDDDSHISAKAERALAGARVISNRPFSLPEGEVGSYTSDSNFADYEPANLASEIASACFEADCIEGGSLNALEIFIYKDTTTLINSRGTRKAQVSWRAMAEAIPTYNGEESVELYEQYNFTEFDRETVRAEIATKMAEVRDRYLAKKPETKLSCPIVLGAPELETLFWDLSQQLGFGQVYQHSNAFSVGDDVQKDPEGDRFTVTMCAAVKGSTMSAAFDSDGVTLEDRTVIENGKACALWGSTRYAQYLGERATGALGCIRVEGGTLTQDELRSQPYFRCASMSGLQLDIYNDYIGGEVRLAYYFDGEKEIPLTGISISGKLSEALAHVRLSRDITTHESYNGPACAVFGGIEIV